MKVLMPGVEKLLIAPLPVGDGDVQLRGTLVSAGATPDPGMVRATRGLTTGAAVWYRKASTLQGRDSAEVVVDLADVLAWEVDAAPDVEEGVVAP